jgi:hypothetical protein
MEMKNRGGSMGAANIEVLADLSKQAGGLAVGKAMAVAGMGLGDKLDLAANEMFVGILGTPIAAFAATMGASMDGPVGVGTAICGAVAVVASGLALHGAGVLLKDQFDGLKEKFGWGKKAGEGAVALRADLGSRLAQKRATSASEPSMAPIHSAPKPMGA